MNRPFLSPKKALVLAISAALFGTAVPALADERGDLEQLRATTLGLIDALVDNGIIPREKAQQLMHDAEAKATARLAEARPTEVGKDGKKVVRVSYVPESMKNEIRDQVKQEVLAQAKTERWGEPGALPSWMDRFQFEGDMRLRYESTGLSQDNTSPGLNFRSSSGNALTRAADITGNPYASPANFNTQDDRDRWRLRARFGVKAKVSDMVSAGLRMTTGNTTDRTSTNQTLGQNFNKYSLVLDRAYLKLDPLSWLSFSGGRIANPFFGTDLVWADDLNFEGVALSLKPELSPSANAFITAGWFPLRENNPLQTTSRDLIGVQGGLDWKFGSDNHAKFGIGMYQYRGLEGTLESDDAYNNNTVSNYGTRSEYPAGFRQRGNTLFLVNAIADPLSKSLYWGLASGYRELNLTGSLDLARFDPVHVILTGDYVKNLSFNRSDIAKRTGTSSSIVDGKDVGYMARLQVGYPETVKRGDWNVSLAYRYLGSDAVLDAFTNSDFGLGGTNNKGFILGANYGLDKNTWISARWLSSNLIDSMAPQLSGDTTPSTKLSVDVFQVDLNAKF